MVEFCVLVCNRKQTRTEEFAAQYVIVGCDRGGLVSRQILTKHVPDEAYGYIGRAYRDEFHFYGVK